MRWAEQLEADQAAAEKGAEGEARAVDAQTAQQVLSRATSITHEEACGATPVNGLLELARRRKLRVELLDLRNSGDTAGGRDRVVGYGSFALLDR